MPAAFTRDPDLQVPNKEMQAVIEATARPEGTFCFDATQLATDLMGDGMAVNLFTIGYACQKGLLPLSRESIEEAIKLNGASVDTNLKAFLWGRCAAHDLDNVTQVVKPAPVVQMVRMLPSLDEQIEKELSHLTEYQNAALAQRYHKRLSQFSRTEKEQTNKTHISRAIAENYSKVLAYKDEYEVARQLTSETFRHQLEEQFEGDFTLEFNLAPPLIARKDKHTGRPRKRVFSQKIMPVFRLLARMKSLRGTPMDIFAWSEDRRLEKQIIRDYETDINLIEKVMNDSNGRNFNYSAAQQLAEIPGMIRGYGPVKEENYLKAKAKRQALHAELQTEKSSNVDLISAQA
jgi:indolepyruvate ferredoxin oxidoreductase